MSDTLARLRPLVARRLIRVSLHGLHELAADEIDPEDAASGIETAIVVEDYPESFKGPSVLVLQRDRAGEPLHVLWGLAKATSSPAVLITAYRPDRDKWSSDFLRRKQ